MTAMRRQTMKMFASSSFRSGRGCNRILKTHLLCNFGSKLSYDVSQSIQVPSFRLLTTSSTKSYSFARSNDLADVGQISTTTATALPKHFSTDATTVGSKAFGNSATNQKVIRDLFMSFATTPPAASPGVGENQQPQPHLKIDNLHDLLKCIGEHPSKQRLQDLLHEVDTDKSGTIEFDEFLRGCDSVLAHDYKDNNNSNLNYNSIRDLDELLRTFRTLDRDGNGILTMDELEGVLSTSGGNLSQEDATLLMKLADKNHDGTIDFTEFVKLVDDPSLSHLSWRLRSAFRAILVIGGPGSGKGLLCDNLVKKAGIVHCSSGDMLRDEVKLGTPLGMEISNIMKQGLLLPSSTVMALIKKRITKLPGEYLALDGFPRSEENYRDFDEVCGSPEFAIYIDVPDEIMMERIIQRGKANSGRVDDNAETAKKRIETFHALGKPTLDYLKKCNIPIHVLDGTKSPENVWVQLLGMNTPLTRRVL